MPTMRTSILQPQSPPVPDISRSKLMQVAHWIRDDLDILVAREGPDVLKPDDVLTLHELFVALRQSTTITALDLRATGIHKAIKDIAGIATRWPGRLCDDCDKILTIWTSKFGRFDELHPFLYGRGGRLEGIASMTEYTREALLKRWSVYCPERIHPKVSHRQGGLGFKAGDWWINPLFAHYAGIIGLESIEGGTTYDKHCAYALVLKDTGEIDARSEESFTYRCPINDRGKFRLTAATPRSREPIRVLRSHSINSIWGPKAGIRYEGLYSVVGWSVRQASLRDTISGDWKQGDILYEVSLQRNDLIPMEEVTRRPTNMEVDDYIEYKRLRKLHREQKRRGPGTNAPPFNAAQSILPPELIPSHFTAPHSLLRVSPNASRDTTFKEPIFDASNISQESDRLSGIDVISPMTVPGLQEPFFASQKSSTLVVPSSKDKNKSSAASSSDNTSREKEKQVPVLSPGVRSLASSTKTVTDELKEIIPWIELEATLPIPPPVTTPPLREVTSRLEAKAAEMNPVKNVRRLARHSRQPSDLNMRSQRVREKETAPEALCSAQRMLGRKTVKDEERHAKKNVFGKKHRFLDGADQSLHGKDMRFDSPSSRHPHYMRSSSEEPPQLYSPTPIRPSRPQSLFAFGHGIEEIEFISPLDELISRSLMATPISSAMSPLTMEQKGGQGTGESMALGKLKRWLDK